MKLYEITSVYEVVETTLVKAEDETEAREKFGRHEVEESDQNIKGEIFIQSVHEVDE